MVTSATKPKTLITGGSGFIGRNIIEGFSDDYEILAPRRSELNLIDDEAVKRFLHETQVDYIIHCATKPGHRNAADPTNLVYFNSLMFFNLVRNSDRYKKMIFIGSGGEYDMRHYRPKMPETYFDAHVPADEHGLSKYIVSKYIERSEKIVNLRVFGIFGKYEDYAIRFISNAICKAICDFPITIKQNRRFDYLYVDDLPGIIEHFMRNDTEDWAYNVTPDDSIELLELAHKVKRISGKDVPVIVAKEGLGVEYSGDNARLRSAIPDLKFTPIEKAISDLYQWYSENMKKIDKTCLLVDK